MSYSDRRSRGIFAAYENINMSRSDNHLESEEVFRNGFTSYSIVDNTFIDVKTTEWDKKNIGGVPLDYDFSKGELYVDSSDSHTLILGATGSKKTRLAIMPMVRNLADAGESMIICDPKSEIYQRTSGYLHDRGYTINAINFRDPSVGDGWNMFSVPFENYLNGHIDKASEQLNDIAITLMPVYSKDPYWDYSARDLFVGLSLLMFYIGKQKSLKDEYINMGLLLQLRMHMFKTSDKFEIMQSNYWSLAQGDPLIKSKLIGTVSCPEKTMSCILSTFDTHVSCFSLKPDLIKMLSKTTIEFERIGEEKIAIFLIIHDEKTTLHKVCSVFIKQTYELLIDYCYANYTDNHYDRRINFIIDEFSSLPVIEDFPQMISASRSRNIRFTLVSQSKGQIVQRYKDEAETIQSNCSNWIFFFTRELELLKEISSLSGINENRDLIPIHRLQHLNKEKGECLILSGRYYPFFAHLVDISQIDNNHYTEYPLCKRPLFDNEIDLEELFQIAPTNDLKVDNNSQDLSNDKDEESIDDLRAELEKKFDELFGNDASEDAGE